MMAVPYSSDLRKKVINLLQNDKKQIEIAKLLDIDKSTVYRWNKRYKDTGNCDIKGYHDNKDKIKVDADVIQKIVDKHPHYTLKMISDIVGNITDVTVANILKRLGYTFKKSHGYIKRGMK